MSEAQFVPPAHIEKELSKIWEALSAPDSKSRRMRACLFNIILVTNKNSRAAYIRGLAQRVIEKFPSRVLFVTIDRDSKEDTLRTGVSVMNTSEAQSDIACDFIEFEATMTSAVRIPFLLLSHILPDLPVYLLWAEDPTLDNPLTYPLEQFATRLIFDSESTNNLPLFAKALLRHQEISKCDIADLNWARTQNWRNLLISTFHSEQRLKELSDAKEIRLTYNVKSTDFFCHTKTQSIYLQGWIAMQLGWVLKEMDTSSKEIIFRYESGKNKTVDVHLVPEEHPEVAPGSVFTFELKTNSDQHFLFTRNPEASYQVTISICSGEKCEDPTQFFFSKGGIGQTLVKEICHKGTSSHYVKLLHFIAGLEELSL